MPYSTLTGKGQITIPKVVRDNLNLKTGDTLYFRLEKGEIKIIPVSKSIEDTYGLLARKKQKRSNVVVLKLLYLKQQILNCLIYWFDSYQSVRVVV